MKSLRLLKFLCFVPIITALQARAEFIQPVAAFASNGAGTQDLLIDGQGFEDPGLGTPDSTHVRDSGQMWSAVGSIREFVVFDLGKTVSLTKVYVWNYNAQDATDVGMQEVEVQISADTDPATANFNTIAIISLKEGGEKAQAFDVVGTNVRLVKLKGRSNWGQGYTVGLAEVRFASGDITGNVPTIVLNSPHEGDEIRFGSDVTLDAKVTDKDADLQKVEFFDGDTLITNRLASPYSGIWKGAAQGQHVVRVVATDKSGKVAWVTANISVRELVADSILKIDDTADEGEGLNQIKYTGTWNLAQGEANDARYNHNDHYESNNNKNDYLEVRFKGVMIEVYATVASHHGSGMASIDGGPESKVIYKAAQRAEQVFVWRSPILANREHVLKIRVVGDGVVTADRFDVSISNKPEVTSATISEVTATFTNLVIKLQDAASSVVNPSTVTLLLDNAAVAASIVKAPPVTTISYSPPGAFQQGSTHSIQVNAKDMSGNSITNQTSFTLPAPFFPSTGLPGPASTVGNWGLRQIWNAGRADSIVSAVEQAFNSDKSGFTGKLQDTALPVINLALSSNPGGAALFPDTQSLPAEAEGLTPSDFVIVAHAKVKIPRAGDWTIGVHSDDGFALRFVGFPFDSVNGGGRPDDNFPEYMGFLTEGASVTRGILKAIPAGEYAIEFVAFQRVGSAAFEIYAAEGAFADDSETDQWQLIGSPDGLQIVAGPKGNITVRTVGKTGDRVTIEFDTPEASGSHQLQESVDLKTWQSSTGAVFEKLVKGVRVSVGNASAPAKFYRVVLQP